MSDRKRTLGIRQTGRHWLDRTGIYESSLPPVSDMENDFKGKVLALYSPIRNRDIVIRQIKVIF
jgi:hypothetical protein